MTIQRLFHGLLMAVFAFLAACGGSSGSGSDASDTGFLSLGVSDGPVRDATKVCIEFFEIELMSAEGRLEPIPIDPPERINLLEFQDANSAPLIVNHELPAGDYQWMRLGINADRDDVNAGNGDADPDLCDGAAGSYIVRPSGVHNIYVPSSGNTGLKLVSGFTIPENSNVGLTAEFDLSKSFTAPPGQDPSVKMRPAIRLVNNVEVGTLTGQVANELVEAESCNPDVGPLVYLFDDGDVPNGIEDEVEDMNDPVATAMIDEQPQDDGSVEYHYTIGFLLAGEYEVAFTCDNKTFEPENGNPVTIAVGELSTVDIEAPPAP